MQSIPRSSPDGENRPKRPKTPREGELVDARQVDSGGARRRSTHDRGARGETVAARYLSDRGYTIIERNFRTRAGEVDIVAVEGGTIAFCEVKSWERMPMTGLEQALSRRKQGRIIRTSLWYLQTHPNLARLQPRYDVLFIGPEGVEHFENAFSERGAW